MPIPVTPEEFLKRQKQATTQTNLPMQTPRNNAQAVPIMPTAVQTQPATPIDPLNTGNAGNLVQQAGQQAQQSAVPQGLTQAIGTSAQQLVQNPLGSFNPMEAARTATSDFAKNQQLQQEAFRQQTGTSSGAGSRQSEMFNRMLQGSEDTTRVGSQLQGQAALQQQQAQIAGLQAGTQAAGALQGLQKGDIDNLLNTANTAGEFAKMAIQQNMQLNEQQYDQWKTQSTQELQQLLQGNDINATRDNIATQLEFDRTQANLGRKFTESQNAMNRTLETSLRHLDLDGQKEMMNLKSMIDKDMLLTSQDFSSAEARLGELHDEAMLSGNTEDQLELMNASNELEKLKLQQQQEYNTSERVATQAFGKNMQMTDQEFNKGMQYLQHQQDQAKAAQNFGYSKKLQQDQFNFEFQKNTQGFNHQQKLAQLDSQLKNAQATHNSGLEQKLMMTKHNLDLNYLNKTQSHDKAMAFVNENIQKNLDNNNFDNAKAMEQQKFLNNKQLADAENSLQELSLKLQEKGIDAQQLQMQFKMIQEGIATGALDPKAGLEFMQKNLSGTGIELQAPNPATQQQAIMKEYENMQLQFALANGIDQNLYMKDGVFTGLPNNMQAAFNKHMTNTLYDIDPVTGKLVQTGTQTNTNNNKPDGPPRPEAPGPDGPVETPGPGGLFA